VKRDPSLLGECLELQRALARHATLVQLKRSPEWPALEPRFERLFGTPRVSLPLGTPRPSADPSRIRAVQWNIEHGNEYEQIETALLHHPDLAGADLLLFNEIDLGCARAGNRDVTADLARALGFHAAFAPLYLETTVGRDDDASAAAGRENQEGLFGIAILSRYPLGAIRIVPLPSPIEIQFDLEHMYGRHAALIVEILRPGAPFVAVSAHLEVHRTREHRAAQVRGVVAALRDERRPIVIAGDFNTHTFDRGLWHAPIEGGAALLVTPGAMLERRLRRPDHGRSREALFDVLRDAGFEWDRFVDREPTLQLRFERLDEFHALPPPMLKAAKIALRWAERRARLRLDWFAGRGWRDGRGRTAHGLDGPGLASDHAPIVAEFA
jgi:endonuclease/exonuclease/phosphatase family metal-dependent hydrolase